MSETESGMRSGLEEMTRDLRALVAELMKNNPDSKNLKKHCEKTGIEYSEDSIELMSKVLKAINSTCTKLGSPRRGGRSSKISH